VKTIVAAMAVVGALVTAPLSQASASPITCERFMSGVIDGDLVVPTGATCTLGFESRVLGDVTVDEGATFRGEAVIEGDVTIGADGIFDTTDGAVGGDIVCDACDRLNLAFMWDPTFEITSTDDVSVTGVSDGHIAIEGWRIKNLEVSGSSGSFTFIEFQVSGDVVFADNVGNAGFWRVSSGGRFEVVGNTAVGGGFPADFTLVGNSARKDLVFSGNTGSSYLEENFAGKDLTCFGNDPPPTGWGNTAGKNVEGQCAALTGPPPE
jgi:hypothetical protein